MKLCVLFFLLGLNALVARAELSLHGLFSDGAVLQQGVEIPVWGKADPGAELVIELPPAKVNAEGRWMAKLPSRSKSSEGAVLSVRSRRRSLALLRSVQHGLERE